MVCLCVFVASALALCVSWAPILPSISIDSIERREDSFYFALTILFQRCVPNQISNYSSSFLRLRTQASKSLHPRQTAFSQRKPDFCTKVIANLFSRSIECMANIKLLCFPLGSSLRISETSNCSIRLHP